MSLEIIKKIRETESLDLALENALNKLLELDLFFPTITSFGP